MRKIKLEQLKSNIERNRMEANTIIRESLPPTRRKKSRSRSAAEREALDKIAVARWQKAVQEGKIKRISKRKMYYDYR
ncbi:hypothetical protein F9U64_14600 [Gracilibacillus oryzae]|uniref:Uncharacterized protein n=1 Tax=Gracilibacillus oryzae TaxID=1672701 RepID=A0A7C8GSB6_9BACI|nr:hypothetical protein [Gracilibacillus oryzae]KAB8129869.1 hypothetical protein F9U64_14600 [Gracilibacillus oryzae]